MPVLNGLLGLSQGPALALMVIRYLLACGLLFGIYPRLSAGLLALSGFYVFLLDFEYYTNNTYFHLILLTLLFRMTGCLYGIF
jgi:hypothetical protein